MKRRWVAMLMAMTTAAGAVSLAGCASSSGSGSTSESARSSAAEAHSNDDVFRVIDNEWYGIDPYQLDSSAVLQQCVSESLFEWDSSTNELVDGVCTDWTVSDDGLTATFNVPEGMYYSTGQEVTAEDVVASIEHGKKVSPYADSYDNIESMEVDGRQVTLHLTSYRSDMLYALCGDFMGIISKDELDSMTDDELMWGCHPYGMYSVSNYVSGSEVDLVRNDKYVTHSPLVENQGAAKLAEIDCTFNVEDYTALESLKNGEVDFLVGITMDDKVDLEGNDAIAVVDNSYPEIDYLELNTTDGPFADKNVRLAFALLLDREAACELTDGQAVPAYSMVYDTMQNFSQEAKDYFQENYANDKERGYQLLEEAGYSKNSDGYYEKDGEVLELDYYTSNGSVSTILGEGLQGQMQENGIKVNLNTIDWNYVHEQVQSNDYDVAREGLGWAEPILILNRCYYDTDAPTNTEAYSEEAADIARTVDSEERTKKIYEIQLEMFENVDILPFYSEITWMAYNADLKNVNLAVDGTYSWNDISWE